MQVQDGIRPTGASRRSLVFRVVSTVALLLTAVVLPLSPARASGDRDAPTQRGLRLLVPPPDIDLDLRTGVVEPTAEQRALVDDLGARVRWTRFATPASLVLPTPVRPDPASPAREAADRSDDRIARLDPPASPERVARAFVAEYAALFRLSDADVARLEVVRDVPLTGTSAHVVTFRQRFASRRGRLPAGDGGLITLGLTGGGRVAYVSSSAYGSASGELPAPRLSPEEAWLTAADSLDRAATPDAVRPLGPARDLPEWHRFSVTGFAQVQHVRLVAVGAPRGARTAIRPAWEANVVDVRNGSTLAATVFVDALTGEVLIRHDRVDHGHASPGAPWANEHVSPSVEAPSGHPAPGAQALPSTSAAGSSAPASPAEPTRPHASLAGSTGLTGARPSGCPAYLLGCGVRTSPAASVPTPVYSALLGLHRSRPPLALPSRPDDPWSRSACDITEVAPEAMARARRHVDDLHTGLRAWLRGLGLDTPEVPLNAHVQAGALTGGYPTYLGRNDAQRITLQTGLPGIESHYLFEPVAGQWYGRCADGALDPTLVAHEYVHGVTEHLVGGPDDGIVGPEGRALAESWSDLLALEFLRQSGAAAEAVGAYVAGDPVRGIRHYPVAANPLNATDLGYAGSAPWADGEIWSAVNHDIRRALTPPIWTRLLLDSLPLQQSRTTMADARDALLAADRMRYDGRHAATLWRTFARRGLGLPESESAGRAPSAHVDARTTPGWRSPLESEGTLHVEVIDAEQGRPVPAEVYVGRLPGGRGVPVADTDPATVLPDRLAMVPGRYELTWTAPRYGMGRTVARVEAGRTTRVLVRAQPNLASAAAGAHPFVPDHSLTPVTGPDVDGSDVDTTGDGAETDQSEGSDEHAPGPQDDRRSLPGVREDLSDTISGLTGLGRRLLPGPYPDVRPPRSPTPPRSPERVTPLDRPESTRAGDDPPDSTRETRRPVKTPGSAGQGVHVGQGVHAPPGQSVHAPAPRAGRTSGGEAGALIDDSEAYGWTVPMEARSSVGDTLPVAAVTIDLAGDRPHRIDRVAISALPRPERPGGRAPTPFSALRRFAIEVCTATATSSCADAPLLPVGAGEATADVRAGAGPARPDADARPAGQWERIYVSAEDAFPAGRPRPAPSDLTFRSFDLPDRWATHVRLVVLDTQCTGNPAYHGVQSADPLTSADCRTSPAARLATIAEFMVYATADEIS